MFGLIKSNHAVEDTEGVLMQVMAPMEKYLSGVVRAEKFRHREKEAAQRPPRRGPEQLRRGHARKPPSLLCWQ